MAPSSPSRRPSSSPSVSQLEFPLTPSQSGTLDQIHASNSGATGLTSFHLGSPPPSTPAPLTFNKIYSKVKSVAAGVREAVREVVVTGPPGNHRSVTNDSRESFEISSSSNRASPAAGNSQFKQRYNNPNRLSLSNASIMTKASTGSTDCGISPALRKVNILSPGHKSIPSPSLAQVTVFRNGAGGGEISVDDEGFNSIARESASGGSPGVGGRYSTPSPSSDRIKFSVKYPPLQNGIDDIPRLGGDGATEKNIYGDSGTVGNPTPSFSAESHAKDLGVNIYVPNHSQTNSTIPAVRGSNISPPSMLQAPVRMNTILNPQKRKLDAGGPPSAKSTRKRPKSVKRTSESLLPGFTYNSESDTDDDEEDNISSPPDNSSTDQGDGARTERNQSAISLITGAGGVRALAGWFGVGRSPSEHQSNDHVTSGGASGSGNGGNIELALQQLRKGTLTREFWMKDENCKDCFRCGKTFNTFRRKHHCRRSRSYSFPS